MQHLPTVHDFAYLGRVAGLHHRPLAHGDGPGW